MHAAQIIGYTFAADLICPPCLRKKAAIENESNGDNAEFTPLDTLLDRWAKREGIDREDEDSFDSDDFPKVTFETGDARCERCGTCNETLSGDDEDPESCEEFRENGSCIHSDHMTAAGL